MGVSDLYPEMKSKASENQEVQGDHSSPQTRSSPISDPTATGLVPTDAATMSTIAELAAKLQFLVLEQEQRSRTLQE